MKLNSFITMLLPLVASASPLRRRDASSPCLYLCTEAGWKGDCQCALFEVGNCYPISLTEKTIQAAGADAQHVCSLYEVVDCSGDVAHHVGFPGNDDFVAQGLDKVPTKYGSFKCDDYAIFSSSLGVTYSTSTTQASTTAIGTATSTVTISTTSAPEKSVPESARLTTVASTTTLPATPTLQPATTLPPTTTHHGKKTIYLTISL